MIPSTSVRQKEDCMIGSPSISKLLHKVGHASAVADHTISTSHNIKWDHFEILATGKSDLQCKIKESLLIRDLKPSLNENIGSEKLFFINFFRKYQLPEVTILL